MAAVGPDKTSPGAELIVRAAERNDARPLWVLAWGGTNRPGGNRAPCLAAGFDDHLTKPVDIARMQRILSTP